MRGFYYIAFIEYIIAVQTLLNYANLFSPNGYKKNDKVVYKYLKHKYDKLWFWTKKIDRTRNYFLEEIKDNELISKKHKKECKALYYFEHVLIFISPVIGCVSISAFASLVGIPIGITSSAVGSKIGGVTAEIKKYKSITMKKKKHDHTVLLAKK